jgi:hypothetical protein
MPANHMARGPEAADQLLLRLELVDAAPAANSTRGNNFII